MALQLSGDLEGEHINATINNDGTVTINSYSADPGAALVRIKIVTHLPGPSGTAEITVENDSTPDPQ